MTAVSDPDPTATDVPVRDAATVVLLRDGADGTEVWLQQQVMKHENSEYARLWLLKLPSENARIWYL